MRNKYPPELLLQFEEIRSSMAIEGFLMTDEQLEQAIEEYLKNPYSGRFAELADKAKREGRPYADVVNEELGLGIQFEPDED